MVDPDPRVSGQGLTFLRSQGVQVDIIGEHENKICQEVNAPFVFRVCNGKPYAVRYDHSSISIFNATNIFALNPLIQAFAPEIDTVILDTNHLSFLTSFAELNHTTISDILPPHINIAFIADLTDDLNSLLDRFFSVDLTNRTVYIFGSTHCSFNQSFTTIVNLTGKLLEEILPSLMSDGSNAVMVFSNATGIIDFQKTIICNSSEDLMCTDQVLISPAESIDSIRRLSIWARKVVHWKQS